MDQKNSRLPSDTASLGTLEDSPIPDFSIVEVMIKELMGQYAGAIANEFSTEEKFCVFEKAKEITNRVATKFGATVVFTPKKVRDMCIKCEKSYVSKTSKSGKYCSKCAKEINDIASKMTCIAPGKNKKECGRTSYGSPYCSLHKKWGEAISASPVLYLLTKFGQATGRARSPYSN